jgi:hypothetical protein
MVMVVSLIRMKVMENLAIGSEYLLPILHLFTSGMVALENVGIYPYHILTIRITLIPVKVFVCTNIDFSYITYLN